MTFEQMWRDLAPVGRSASSGGYFRQPWTTAETELRTWFAEQARARGLRLVVDALGNQVAWWDPADGSGARTDGLLTGSHLDSVLDGGAYDGPLGVVSAFAALDRLREQGHAPARPLGVAAFVEEEGSRFGRACLGSRLAVGAADWTTVRELRDRDGVALPDALVAAGLDPAPLERGDDVRDGTGILAGVAAYVELHVEQGRDLVHRDVPVALGSQIWPHGRWRFDFTGEANHAGTTRMEDRRNPMLTYAMTALAADKQARLADLRATFGRVEVSPNGVNAVPGRVSAWLDARGADDAAVRALVATVERQATERADRDGTAVTVSAESVTAPVHFDTDLTARIDAAVVEGGGLPVIPTGAGHDAGVLAEAGVPTAMLHVRNPSGVSHAPGEHAETADCLAGVEALAAALRSLTS
ncbi:allantoate amidohydrolase [Nocardioides sp. CFH 31398]|uniref:allantoate amidohydrolase n=1 Tax=Nocardioides sp. CFH 31398 TaxID=2919579 RepID=UPI001F054847|nr:allantoate amidohydrolase [Nocardioides sp. CFH 31398]MCH1865009.1 allantoate amidohydrolase [Nocardioides sp. CFH 31398]